jgi:D-alanyl-D-alanine carboxypeptidase
VSGSATDRLQSKLDAEVGRGRAHNVVAAMQSYDRRFDFVGAAGFADHRRGEAMTPDTPFFIASVTKMFTAAIVMALHEQKQLDLDAPISHYLPDSLWAGIHVYQGTDYSGRIRVGELVAQTSGLADYETGKRPGGKSVIDELKAGADRAIATPEAVAIVRGLSPKFPPGTPGRAHYSNLNYRLLGAIIESVTGRSMAANFEESICVPLGLKHTYLFDHRAPARDRSPATIYLKNAPANIPKYLSSNVSDGGLVSTALECMTFLRAFFEGRLFDRKLFGRMTKWNRIFFPMSYGYGIMYFRLPRFFWPTPLPGFVGHSGTTGSFAFMCPSRSMYLTGTVDQVSPAKPFFLMMALLRAAS